MSICRWSSDDCQCDAYVWADCDGGFRTEIAGRRRVWDIDLPPHVSLPVGAAHSDERKAWVSAHAHRMGVMSDLMDDESNWHWVDVPMPFAGSSYWHGTETECADNLESLRAAGLSIPESAINALRDEATR